MQPQFSSDSFLSRREVALILLCLSAVGLYLRLRNLGEIGFWGDEDLTALAVKGILEHGYPRLPTGALYLRSGSAYGSLPEIEKVM